MSKLILNKAIQEMPLGEGEGTVLYDPETENTHILDDVALDILNLFREYNTEEKAVDTLLTMYDAPRDRIENDVHNFIIDALEHRILFHTEE